MIRMARLTDYAIVLLTHIARGSQASMRNARDLAAESRLPLPTVSKVLKILAREGLLVAHRGAKGGFTLARRAEEITVADIIGALEGPIALTECSDHSNGPCVLEARCPVGSNWRRINRVVRDALGGITLLEMTRPLAPAAAARAFGAAPRVCA